jgi:hypothetical protein
MVSRYAREEGWELAEEGVFRDDGYSGTTLKRPVHRTLPSGMPLGKERRPGTLG